MKIRKTEPSVGILGKIVNLFSNSTKDTYSCDYINKINNYSTEETFTGKYWINGKPIYRKVIDIGVLPNNTILEIDTGLDSTIVRPINMHGYAYNSTSGAFLMLPYLIDGDGSIYLAYIASTSKFRITTTTDRTHLNAYIVLEYTKTTD